MAKPWLDCRAAAGWCGDLVPGQGMGFRDAPGVRTIEGSQAPCTFLGTLLGVVSPFQHRE